MEHKTISAKVAFFITITVYTTNIIEKFDVGSDGLGPSTYTL